MFPKTITVVEECSTCKESVAISYECPSCKIRVCMVCAIEKDWKCPKCKGDLV